MRIAVIATPWAPVPPPGYGGIELVVDRLATGFQREGHEVLLFATGDSRCPVPRASVLPEAEHLRIGASLPELRHVMAAYDAVEGYDVVHDHTVLGPLYAARFPDRKVLTTAHGPFDDELADVYGRIAGSVPLIAISKAQCAPVPHIPIARVIHHGIDVEDFPLGAGKGDYCLFLGRMSPDKGAHRAVEVAAKAGVPLVMAAKMREPAELEYFDAFVKPQLSDDIRYEGEVGHHRKLELLADARCLVFPIRWNEPFGMVMIEAMACGTPVVAFAEGAAPEVVDHGVTGFLCEDETAMAEAIGGVASLDRAACRAGVAGHFSTRRMVRDHLELFEQVLAG